MAESYTTPHSLPILGTTDLVRSPSGDNIRKQINAVSTATNTALESVKATAASYSSTAETNAKAYTDAREVVQGGRITSLEAHDLTLDDGQDVQDGRLSLLESAAGFSAPPLGFQDSVVAGLVASDSTTRGNLDGRYLKQDAASQGLNVLPDPMLQSTSLNTARAAASTGSWSFSVSASGQTTATSNTPVDGRFCIFGFNPATSTNKKDFVPAAPGMTVKMSGQVYTSGSARSRFVVYARLSDNTTVSGYAGSNIAAAGARSIEGTYVLPAKTVGFAVDFIVHEDVGQFTVYGGTVIQVLDRSYFGVTPKEFGAVGDGVTDDTAALQAWLDSPTAVKRGGGATYGISANLNCSITNARIIGPMTIKVISGADVDMLNLTGAGALVRDVTLDGNSKARYGVYATGAGSTIERCTISNMYSTTNSPRGIYTSTPGGVTIRHNKISNINAPGNATAGDNNGLARGIVMHALTACTAPSICAGNIVDNITGEEADAIAVLYSDTVVTTYLSGYTLIQGNQIRNSSRRYIKVQGSNVVIDSNWCWAAAGFPVGANPSNVIDIIQGKNIRISNNRVEEIGLLSTVSIAGASTERITDITVSGNYLSEGDSSNPVVYISYADNVVVTGNTLVGGTYYVQGGTCDGLVVASNVCRAGITANVAFSLTSSAIGKVRLNTIPTGRAVGTSTNVVFDGNA